MIDQRVEERLGLPACQGTGSSSWSQITGQVETLSARSVCLSGLCPGCPSSPFPAKSLVVVCIHNHNVHVMLIGFVRWRVEGLREAV